MRKLRWSAMGAIAALIVGTGSVGAAPPSLDPPRRLCEREGGLFFDEGTGYHCNLPGTVTDRQARPARGLCLAYKGEFIRLTNQYGCVFPS